MLNLSSYLTHCSIYVLKYLGNLGEKIEGLMIVMIGKMNSLRFIENKLIIYYWGYRWIDG